MYPFPIGVILESFRLERSAAIKQAAVIGAAGIQMYATKGENAPENLNTAARRALLREVKDNGLVFSALCGDLGKGFGDPRLNPELIEKSKRIVDLAKDLETDIVTTHIGVVPADPNHDRYKIMQDACFQLASYADSVGAHFAVETGPETSATLKVFLDSLNSTGVAVNLDPANLVMVAGDRPETAVKTLGKYIVHTHAKDGIKLQRTMAEGVELSPEAKAHNEMMDMGRKYLELPLGQGGVNFDTYLPALKETGFDGFLTIEREVGETPEKDIGMAARFLAEKIRQYNL